MTKFPLPFPIVTGRDGSVDPEAVQANFDALAVQVASTSPFESHGYWEDATEESTTSTSYVSLGDEVVVTLPNNGLIHVAYLATWKQTVSLAAACALHFNSDQQRYVHATLGDTFGVTAQIDDEINKYIPLAATPHGMMSLYTAGSPAATAYAGDVTTGQALGLSHLNPSNELIRLHGEFVGWAAAGTYTVGPKFKTSSGTVTVKNRKLWVATQSYPNQA